MRTFLELLPYRIEHVVGWRAMRITRARWARRIVAPTRRENAEKRRLYVDLSVISNHDAGTGIQRVVRAIAFALTSEAQSQWDIRFVSARKKKRYFEICWPTLTDALKNDGLEMRARPGDVFVGLDYALDAVRRHRRQLARFRKDGGTLWFLVHDLLPLNHPEWFSSNTVIRYQAWLGILAGLADGFLCNSPQTEDEIRTALAEVYGISDGYQMQVLPMGHAIVDPDQAEIPALRFDGSVAFALMVGTLEPRKGHADVIAAFEELWRQGRPDRLVLVGRLGWHVDALRELIMKHPEYQKRLLWFDDVGDAELFGIYDACTGVIIASHGEGFGLPVIEALGQGKPVLARDLAVFRVHQSKGLQCFPANASAAEIAKVVGRWLDAAKCGEIAVTRPSEDWRASANKLLEAIG